MLIYLYPPAPRYLLQVCIRCTLQQVRHILALFTLALNSPPNAVTAVHRADRALPADVHCAKLHVPSYSSEMAT